MLTLLSILILSAICGATLYKYFFHDRLGNELYCAHCGYNLSYLESGVCPECGRQITSSTTRRGKPRIDQRYKTLVLLAALSYAGLVLLLAYFTR